MLLKEVEFYHGVILACSVQILILSSLGLYSVICKRAVQDIENVVYSRLDTLDMVL